MQKHIVILKDSDGSPATYPMREWLRRNPTELPDGYDPDSNNSHQLRRGLQKMGWKLEELEDRIWVIKPDENGNTSYADILYAEFDFKHPSDEDEMLEASEITFGLERDLQSALRTNIEQLEPGLRIIDGGKERVTEAGHIDITAQDNKGNVVIVELKAGMAQPEAVTQLLAYMSTVSDSDKKPIRGILVAGDFHKKVILASRAISNLQLKKYSFQFTFENVD